MVYWMGALMTLSSSRPCLVSAFSSSSSRVSTAFGAALPTSLTRRHSSSHRHPPAEYYRSNRRSQAQGHPQQSASQQGSDASMPSNSNTNNNVPVYPSEGLFSVIKPLDWTSANVVSFIRIMLERDAKERGATFTKKKRPFMKVGHGGTLDPLATGVLVIGVGRGTKELQSYLSGSKRYRAGVELGFETTTLDLDPTGNVTKRAPYDHITMASIEQVLPTFRGTISQIPPLFSAIRVNGKRLYQRARDGEQDVKIESRKVVVHNLELIHNNTSSLPQFKIDVECGGGTYIRSLVRDIGYELDSVATMTALERTQQGQFFTLDGALKQDDWTVDNINNAIDRFNAAIDQ